MTERPIIFSGPMVRAILAGRKTQTRRIVKGVGECPHGYDGVVTHTVPKEAHLVGQHCFNLASGESAYLNCPYGAPGHRLWVRETMGYRDGKVGQAIAYRATGELVGRIQCERGWESIHHGWITGLATHQLEGKWYGAAIVPRWTPAIHMPRWASRIALEVTKVRVERLFQLSEKDARAEGMLRQKWHGFAGYGWTSDEGQPTSETARRAFEDLWHSINGHWVDCWVWVIEFRRVNG